MDRLRLGDKEHKTKYPVLLLLHDLGGASVDWQQTPAERCAAENGIFIIAPDAEDVLGTDMVYGPKYETFISGELLGICRNLFPISQDPASTWIGGVGTGAYGAVKTAIQHPDVFSKAVSIDGILDMGAIIKKALAGEETGIRHDQASLAAVFGALNQFEGSSNDLFALAEKPVLNEFFCFFARRMTDGSARASPLWNKLQRLWRILPRYRPAPITLVSKPARPKPSAGPVRIG